MKLKLQPVAIFRVFLIGLVAALLVGLLPVSLAAPASGVSIGIQRVSGKLWLDVDGDQARTSADQPLSGVQLWLFSDNGDQQFKPNLRSVANPGLAQPGTDNFVKAATSDANGSFGVSVVAGGRYWVYADLGSLPDNVSRADLPLPTLVTAPASLDLRFESTDHAVPTEPPSLMPIGGTVWYDVDDNGTLTTSDQMLAGVTVRVFADDGDQAYQPNTSTIDNPSAALPSGDNFVASGVSDGNGAFLISVPSDKNYWIDVNYETLTPEARAARSLLPIFTSVPARVDIRFGNTLPPVTPIPTEPVVPTAPLVGHVWVDTDLDNQRTSADLPGSGATFWAFLDDGSGVFEPGLSLNDQGALVGDAFLTMIVADAQGDFSVALPSGATVLLVLDTASLAPAIDPAYESQPLQVSVPSAVELRFPGAPAGSTPPAPTEEAAATVEPTAEATAAATAEATLAPTAEATVEATLEATAEATVLPTEEAAVEPVVSLKGNVFDDANSDRSESQDEAGLANIVVRAYADDGDGEFDADAETLEGETRTDSSGGYLIEDLKPGSYWVEVDTATLPAKYVDTFEIGKHGQQNPMLVTLEVEDGSSAMRAAFAVTEVPVAEATAEVTEAAPEATESAGTASEAVVEGPSFAFAKDTDGDDKPDGVEGTGDHDNDGIPNYLDPYDPSGVFYVDDTGNVLAGIGSSLYADMNTNGVYDGGDVLANTVESNPQVSDVDGAYSYNIITTNPSGTGIPNDGSTRRFFLIINTGSLPTNITYPSPLVTNYGIFDASNTASDKSGEIVPYSSAPNPPIDNSPRPPAQGTTHGYYDTFDITLGDDSVVNNHVAFALSDSAEPNYFELTPNNVKSILPGDTWVYSHTLLNDTGADETYVINPPDVQRSWSQVLRVYDSSVSLIVELEPSDIPYVVGPVTNGDYLTLTLDVTPPIGTNDSISDLTTITVYDQATPAITRTVSDLTTAGLTCLTGQVFNDTNRDGNPNNSSDFGVAAHVIVYNVNDYTGGTAGTVADLSTGTLGVFSVDGLPAGTYRVEVVSAVLNGDFVDTSDYDDASQEVTTTLNTSCNVVMVPLSFGNPSLDMKVDDDQLAPGEETTFRITAKNTTDAPITNIQVSDLLPDDMIYEASTLDPGDDIDFDEDNNVVYFDLADMAPGDEVEMTVKITIDSATDLDSIKNRVRMTYDEGPDVSDSVTIDLTSSSDATATASTSATATTRATVPTTLPTGYPGTLPTTGLEDGGITPAMIAGLAIAAIALLFGIGLLVIAVKAGRQQHRSGVSPLVIGVVALLFVAVGLVSAGSVFVTAQQPVSTSALDVPTLIAAQPSDVPSETSAAETAEVTTAPQNVRASLVDYGPGRRQGGARAEASSVQLSSAPVSMEEWLTRFQPPGKPATHIMIPALNIDTTLVEAPVSGNTWDVSGFTTQVAHLQGTAYPGTVGNAVLAGHITYSGGPGPFRHLDQLYPGDLILAKGEGVVYRYVVKSVETVDINDIQVTAPKPGANLTLITCTGWDAATRKYTQRLVVNAVLRAGAGV